jgi:hypothetical protein
MRPVMSQYGVNSATVASAVTTQAPTLSTTNLADSNVTKIIQAAQASGTLQAYQSNRLMIVFLASGLSVQTTGGCAYHNSENSTSFYAVVPKDCTQSYWSPPMRFSRRPLIRSSAKDGMAVDGCTTSINLEFGSIPGPADNDSRRRGIQD